MLLRGVIGVALVLVAACGKDTSDRPDPMAVGGAGGAAGASGGAAGPLPIDNPELDASAGGMGGGGGGGAGGRMCGIAGCGQSITGHGGVVDMLFVVDNSSSMTEEQTSLAEELPRMMRKLTTGDHDEDGTPEYEGIRDLHLGVVSTNLGGVANVPGCTSDGDSGKLLHAPTPTMPGCEGDYPTFLTYVDGQHDPEQVAADFACLAQVGIAGCGFEQPLESALQALWPSADPVIRFVSTTTEASLGRGDRENAGFLRNDPTGEPATLAIVLVTDEDDCSAFDPGLWQTTGLPAEDPRAMQALNLRCHYNPQSLYDLDRYAVGYRALHGWTGARVLFAAIVGVPVDLVDQIALAEVDWNDEAQREAHYEKILSDERMQEMPVDTSGAEAGPDNLEPSCMTEHGTAYPPRRIVSLARKFGPNSLVQSICGDNLGPPIEIIIRRVLEGPE